MELYSVKMRASKKGRHVSGAERIIPTSSIPQALTALSQRALHHGLGQADFINIKVEALPENIKTLQALPVSSRFAATKEASFAIMASLLKEMDLADPEPLLELLQRVQPMRGAILYDVATKSRLEPDQGRGIRVTYMDSLEASKSPSGKNHFREALVLATKVVSCPGIIAELCISDDPDYVTGYFASLKHGYVRLSPLKETGDSHGGRIFIFDSRKASAQEAIAYLEKTPVLVAGLPAEAVPQAPKDPQAVFAQELQQLKEASLYRSCRIMDSEQSKYVDYEGRQVLLLASNSYLDLAAHPKVKEAAAKAALTWGAGSGGSRLTTGTIRLHQKLEAALARSKNMEAALLFNTGYMANLGLISGLCNHNEAIIFSDEYNHASIIDGARLSKAKIIVYKHNDMADLEKKIKATSYSRGLIISDAVFSMDGDIVDLPQLVALGKKYGLLTAIDEAHATGVIGATGKGTVEHYGNSCKPDIIMGTLSKALGAEGGFVAASQILIDYLLNKARSFIFSTAQSPATLGAALAALEILEQEPDHIARLQHNVTYFCQALKSRGIEATSPTAIIPIIIGDEGAALSIAQDLLEKGCLIPAIRYPTVPKGTARLRVALMSSHTEAELDHTAELISQAIKKAHL